MMRTVPLRHVLRALVVLLIDALALVLLAAILPGFELNGAGAALGVAAVIGILNGLVWPVLSRYALPLNVLTLGFAALAINGVFVVAATAVIPGAAINDWLTGVGVVIGLTILTALTGGLLANDDDDNRDRNVVSRQAPQRGDRTGTTGPGVPFPGNGGV